MNGSEKESICASDLLIASTGAAVAVNGKR